MVSVAGGARLPVQQKWGACMASSKHNVWSLVCGLCSAWLLATEKLDSHGLGHDHSLSSANIWYHDSKICGYMLLRLQGAGSHCLPQL